MERVSPMPRITDWVAQRSGDSLTIHGRTLEGDGRVITGVARIAATDGGVVATTKAGAVYLLCAFARARTPAEA